MKNIRLVFFFPFLLLVMLPIGISFGGPIDDLKPGEWYAIPNSKLSGSGVYPPSPVPSGQTGPSAVIDAWSGGAYDTKRDHFLIHGGGHGDYSGNEIYSFDLNSLTWSRLWGPSANIPPATDPAPDAYPDGNPASVHTYDGLVYLPTQDAMWRGGGSVWSGSGGGTSASWFFNFSSNSWQRKADSQWLGVSECSDYDPITGHIFAFSDRGEIGEYNPSSNSWTNRVDLGGIGVGEEMTCAIDPDARVMVAMGNGQVAVYNIQSNTVRNQSTTGGSSVVNMRGPALAYDSAIKKIVGWGGGTSVYSLNTSTWSWNEHVATNSVTPTAPTRVGVFSRWQYVPGKNIYLLLNSVSDNVFAYKLASGSTPPDTQPPAAPTHLRKR